MRKRRVELTEQEVAKLRADFRQYYKDNRFHIREQQRLGYLKRVGGKLVRPHYPAKFVMGFVPEEEFTLP